MNDLGRVFRAEKWLRNSNNNNTKRLDNGVVDDDGPHNDYSA